MGCFLRRLRGILPLVEDFRFAQMRPPCLTANGFQHFPQNPTLTQNNRKYQTIENAENPINSRAFGVLSFRKSENISGARISVSKTISKTFLEKSLDKSAPNSPVASHIITAKSATTVYSQSQSSPIIPLRKGV